MRDTCLSNLINLSLGNNSDSNSNTLIKYVIISPKTKSHPKMPPLRLHLAKIEQNKWCGRRRAPVHSGISLKNPDERLAIGLPLCEAGQGCFQSGENRSWSLAEPYTAGCGPRHAQLACNPSSLGIDRAACQPLTCDTTTRVLNVDYNDHGSYQRCSAGLREET